VDKYTSGLPTVIIAVKAIKANVQNMLPYCMVDNILFNNPLSTLTDAMEVEADMGSSQFFGSLQEGLR
jgi:hypothetical protein